MSPLHLRSLLTFGLLLPYLTACRAPVGAPAAGWQECPAIVEYDARLRLQVEQQRLSGAVFAVLHRGEVVHSGVVGYADLSEHRAMEADTVFRIFSMTKPVTSVAALQLVERGLLDLDAPVAAYLPEFSGGRVLTAGASAEQVLTEPLERAPTVRDLLTHTSGLTYAFFEHPVLARLYAEAELEAEGDDALEHARKLAALPLQFQPGSAWQYGRSTDVLGAIVEVVSGERLDSYLEGHVLGPLGMRHTGFVPRAGDQGKLARLYEAAPAGGLRIAVGDALDPAPEFCSGGGGLLSTRDDYLRFCRMLANGGELEGVRILEASTVAEMTRDQIAGLPRPDMLRDRGFGLGFALLTEESASPENGAAGGYHWSGMGGTSFFVDPENELVAVFLVQAWRDFSFMTEFRHAVYAARAQASRQP